MKYLPAGSIRGYLSIPQTTPKNVGTLPTPVATARIKKFWENAGEASPDKQALEFYCLNHLVSIVRAKFSEDEVLPQWAQDVMKAYVESLTSQGQRMYAYMLLIITREARHNHNNDTKDWFAALPNALKLFLKSIQDSAAESAVNTICDTPPDMPLGEYVADLELIFNKGSWGGGYGGKPWGKIAGTLRKMVQGEISLELMVDSAYSLAHNNGPMFNKGMMYGHYTGEFIKILDVQRSGQVPEAVLTNAFSGVVPPSSLMPLITAVRLALPGVIGDSVDWDKVEKDGVGKYPKQKKAAPKKPATPVKIGTKTATETGLWEVMPGVSVKMLKRVA